MVLLHLKNHHNQEEEAFPVFFKPAIAKSNIEGHMIDKNKPPDMKRILRFQYQYKQALRPSLTNLIFQKALTFFQHFSPIKLTPINNNIHRG
jgi:hypothetical protein